MTTRTLKMICGPAHGEVVTTELNTVCWDERPSGAAVLSRTEPNDVCLTRHYYLLRHWRLLSGEPYAFLAWECATHEQVERALITGEGGYHA